MLGFRRKPLPCPFLVVAITVTLTLAGAVLAPPSLRAEWSGTTQQVDGVLHVLNGEQPIEPAVTVHMNKLWEVGGDDDDDFFGVIARILEDENGEVFALDSQLNEIKVYSSDGEWLRTIGREGEGPGEFRSGSDMFLGPGNLVGVVQIFPGKIIQLTKEGDPAHSFPLPKVDGFQLVFQTRGQADRVVVAGALQKRDGNKQLQQSYLKAFAPDGTILAEYHEELNPTQFGGMKFEEERFTNFQRRWNLLPDGRVAAAIDFHKYQITIWGPDGTIDRVIHRDDYAQVERADDEMARFQTMYDSITSWNPGSSFKVSQLHQDVSGIVPRRDGSMWVLSSRGLFDAPSQTLAVYDEYDVEGHFVRRLHLDGPGDAVEDGLYIVDDRVYVVTSQLSSFMASMGGGSDEGVEEDGLEEELEPMRIICYEITESATR